MVSISVCLGCMFVVDKGTKIADTEISDISLLSKFFHRPAFLGQGKHKGINSVTAVPAETRKKLRMFRLPVSVLVNRIKPAVSDNMENTNVTQDKATTVIVEVVKGKQRYRIDPLPTIMNDNFPEFVGKLAASNLNKMEFVYKKHLFTVPTRTANQCDKLRTYHVFRQLIDAVTGFDTTEDIPSDHPLLPAILSLKKCGFKFDEKKPKVAILAPVLNTKRLAFTRFRDGLKFTAMVDNLETYRALEAATDYRNAAKLQWEAVKALPAPKS